MPTEPVQSAAVDIAIIGGGIAGLWLLNCLTNRGYNAILLEHKALGSDQTVASQGMIHGGIKYTLGGTFTGASEAIADMPDHWRACLRGEGDVDLREAKVLSDHFYLWSSATVASRITAFLASKATRGRVDTVAEADRPPLFRNQHFRGSLYKLVDMVLDTPSVVKALADNFADRLFHIDWENSRWRKSTDGKPSLCLATHRGALDLSASAFVLTAGKGNEDLLAELGADSPKTQRRPLHQVMVRHSSPHRFYGHCLGSETTPRLTISSHPCGKNTQVWYLGGSLAESGVDLESGALIQKAKNELAELMPWMKFENACWATLRVDRAEPRQRNFARPDKAFAQWIAGCDNVIAAWPTKLTLAPNLATEVLHLLRDRRIEPGHRPSPQLPLDRPGFAPTPWQTAFDK